MTRRSPASRSACAFCGSSAPFVVRVTSSPPIAASRSISSSRSRRSSGSPPVIRIFSTPCCDERAREPLELLEREQLLAVHEPVAAAEHLLRHAVDAAEVAPVGDGDAQVAERAAEGVGDAHPGSVACPDAPPVVRAAARARRRDGDLGRTRSSRSRTRSRIYPLFAFLAVRFAISTVVLAPFAWTPLRSLPPRGYLAGCGAGALLALGLRAADRRARADDGLEHGLHHRAVRGADAAARARALQDAVSPPPPGPGSCSPSAGCCCSTACPGGSALGNALVLGNAVAQTFQIVAMERYAPRYDPRALTFLQMATAFVGFVVIAGRARRARGAARLDGLGRAARDGRLRGRARLPRRDLGAGAHDRRPRGARVHARGSVRRAVRRAARRRGARLARLDGLRGDAAGIVLAEPAAGATLRRLARRPAPS